MRHPETELIALLRGELVGPARDRVERHLGSCPACREARDDFRRTLAMLERSGPEPPPLRGARYRAELREKLEARRQRSAAPAWWRWPFPLALSAGLAGMLVFLAVHRGVPPAERAEVLPSEEAAIARRLDLLRNYQLVERLDLLEDFDILRNLDSPGRRES
jgi:anti-sigma factor RsiW